MSETRLAPTLVRLRCRILLDVGNFFVWAPGTRVVGLLPFR